MLKIFHRRWRRESAWRKEQEAAFTAAKKAADDESQAMALALLAVAEAIEKEAQMAAEAASKAKITLDGYKRDTRHSSTQRMASDLALSNLRQARRERHSVKRQIATKVETCAANLPAALVASGLVTEDIATTHDGSDVPIFLAVRKLRIEAVVKQARKKRECEARNKRFAAWSLGQQTHAQGAFTGVEEQHEQSVPLGQPAPNGLPGLLKPEGLEITGTAGLRAPAEVEVGRGLSHTPAPDKVEHLNKLLAEQKSAPASQPKEKTGVITDEELTSQYAIEDSQFRVETGTPSQLGQSGDDPATANKQGGGCTFGRRCRRERKVHWREQLEQSVPLGQPAPDAPPGPPEPEGLEITGGEGRCRRERKPVDYVSERVSNEMEQSQSVKRIVHSRDSTYSDEESDDEDDDHAIDRAGRKQDGKGRRTGAKLVLTSSCAAEASMLGTLEGYKNSLMAKLPYRDPKRITGELPLGAVEVATMPLMEQYEASADGRLQWNVAMTAWLRKNTRDKVVQKRWAAAREKKVGLIHNWLTTQGHSQWAEWQLDDPSNPNSGWILRLIVSDGVPSLPTAQQISGWAFAYSKGIAKKGGDRKYRAQPWYGKINGGSQADMLMPKGKERAYGYGAFADEPPRYTTVEQYLSALRQWLKEELRDYPLVANPADTQMVREVTRTLEGQQGRAVVEERLPRALTEQEIAGARVI